MDVRIGFIGIVISNRADAAPEVNALLSKYGDYIRSRTGLPSIRKGTSVITLIVELSSDQMGAITGELGNIPGVRVKSALAPRLSEQQEN